MKTSLEYHINNGYFVKVQRLKQALGCFVEYPTNLLKSKQLKSYISCYFIKDNFIEILEQHEDKDSKFTIACPNYAYRTAILVDILANTNKNNLKTSLIYYFDNNGDLLGGQDIVTLLDIQLDKESLVKENKLMNLTPNVVLGEDCSQIAQEYNVLEGYKIVKGIIDNGELKC